MHINININSYIQSQIIAHTYIQYFRISYALYRYIHTYIHTYKEPIIQTNTHTYIHTSRSWRDSYESRDGSAYDSKEGWVSTHGPLRGEPRQSPGGRGDLRHQHRVGRPLVRCESCPHRWEQGLRECDEKREEIIERNTYWNATCATLSIHTYIY